MSEDFDSKFARRNERVEAHLTDGLLKCVNHHIYEYPSLTETQVVGCLLTVLLNYHLSGIEETVRETILEALGDFDADEDDEEEGE